MDLAGPKLRTGPIEPGPRVVRIGPLRDRLGAVTETGRAWLTASPGVDPPAELSSAIVVPIDDPDWIARRRVDDRLELEDSRGAKRSWKVIAVHADGCLAAVRATTYVQSGLKVTCRSTKVGVGSVERNAGYKGHTFVDGAFRQFGTVPNLATRTGQPRPDKQTALGLFKRYGVTQFLAQRIAHGKGALGIHLAHMGQGSGHTTGLEVLRGRGLGKGAGVGVAELLAHGGLGQQLGRRNQPAHAQAGAEYLAE